MAFSRHSTHNLARSTPPKQGERAHVADAPTASQPAPWEDAEHGGQQQKTYTILAYVLGWIGGLIFLFVGKDDADVEVECRQLAGRIRRVVSSDHHPELHPSGEPPGPGPLAGGLVYWVIFLIQSLQGNGERIPAPGISGFINKYVDQLANSVK